MQPAPRLEHEQPADNVMLDEIAELLSTEDEKQQQREITDNLPRKYQAQS